MRRLLVLLFVLLLSRSSSANYIFYVTPVGSNSVVGGQSVTFDISLSMSSNQDSFDLQSFSLYFDVHATGQSAANALPSGIGTISVSNYLADFGSLGANPSYQLADDFRSNIGRPTFDFEVNANKSNGTTPVTTSTLPLFRMTMNTGTMASGGYELSFVADPSYLDSNDANISLGLVPITGSGDPGTYDPIFSIVNQPFFIITAVPEPSSATLSLLPLVALLFRRKRKVD